MEQLDKGNIKKCARCKMSVYCSKECLAHDWKESKHKLACKHLAKYAAQMSAVAASEVKVSGSDRQQASSNDVLKEPSREGILNRLNCVIM